MIGIIGGSGLTRFEHLADARRETPGTRWGTASGAVLIGRFAGVEVAFLPRHGADHSIAPHEINYRANIASLRDVGVTEIIAVATVGGIPAHLGPGMLLVPDQLIDYTWGRASTFFEGPGEAVKHIDFTWPYAAGTRARLLNAARRCGETLLDGGTYAATQGPRLETRAEIDRLDRDGAHVVGMTGMPEAVLARELGLGYATLAVVVNHAAGRGGSTRAIPLESLGLVMADALQRVSRILEKAVCS